MRKENILIVSTTGLGDTLWGTPVIRAIRKKFPNAYIAILTRAIGHDVLLHNPHIDELFVIKDPALFSCLSLLPSLREKEFGTILVFHTSQRPILPLCYFTKAHQIIGSKGINKGLDSILTKSLEDTDCHEIQRRLDIAKEIGVQSNSFHMEMFLTDKEKEKALSFLKDLPRPLIGMHPGAKDRFKRWNPKHFITLGNRLVKEKKATLFITGNCEEKELAQKIAQNIPGAISIAGECSIRMTAALIEKFNFFITNDTGPMHIAFAMKTPTIALFSATDPKRCGPYHAENVSVIYKNPTCIPCIRKRCRVPFCLEQISPEEVWADICEKLYKIR